MSEDVYCVKCGTLKMVAERVKQCFGNNDHVWSDSPVARHVHDVSCSFGNPQCNAFMVSVPGPLHTPTEAKFIVSLLLTVHALMCVLIIRWDYALDHVGPFAVGLVGWSAFIAGLVRYYLTFAFPKEQ